jgi:hypothetical protein
VQEHLAVRLALREASQVDSSRSSDLLYPVRRMPAKKGKGGRIELLIATHSLTSLAGASLHTLDLRRGFKRVGHDVSVFTLHKGTVSATLEGEGFPVYSLQDNRHLGGESFDLIFLCHATCEALLGPMFAGRVPIVRGYIGRGSTLANPVNGGFASAATYISEGVRELMVGLDPCNARIPALIARNVYDDQGSTAVRASQSGRRTCPTLPL